MLCASILPSKNTNFYGLNFYTFNFQGLNFYGLIIIQKALVCELMDIVEYGEGLSSMHL